MYDPFRKTPQFGSTDWAARKIRAMLDAEERRRTTPTRRGAVQTAQMPTDGGETGPEVLEGAENADMTAYPQSQTHPYPPPYLAYRQTPESRRALIDSIISDEGSRYTNDPADRGGPTRFGITSKTIEDYRDRIDPGFNQTPDRLSRDEAVRIYDGLIQAYRLDLIPDPDLRAQVIDIMVHSGIDSAGKMLLDVMEERGHDVRTDPNDNVVGRVTRGILRDLVNQRDEREVTQVHNELARRRRAHLLELIQKDPSQEKYRDGWLNRADSFRILPTGRQR